MMSMCPALPSSDGRRRIRCIEFSVQDPLRKVFYRFATRYNIPRSVTLGARPALDERHPKHQNFSLAERPREGATAGKEDDHVATRLPISPPFRDSASPRPEPEVKRLARWASDRPASPAGPAPRKAPGAKRRIRLDKAASPPTILDTPNSQTGTAPR